MPVKINILLIMLAFCAFASLGLPDGVLGVTWPKMAAEFNMNIDSLGVLLLTTTCGYFVSSFSSIKIVKMTSLGSVLILSTALSSLALFCFRFHRSGY